MKLSDKTHEVERFSPEWFKQLQSNIELLTRQKHYAIQSADRNNFWVRTFKGKRGMNPQFYSHSSIYII